MPWPLSSPCSATTPARGWPHHNAHLHGAVANGWRVEFHYLMWRVGVAIFRDPPGPDKGWVTIPERPGLGLEPREEVLRDTEQP